MTVDLPILSILIATTIDRRGRFLFLKNTMERLIGGLPIELLFEEDNKEISIGKKRQILLERSRGEYIVFIDSDDMANNNYVDDVINALKTKPDCVGHIIIMTTNGWRVQKCCHSLKYKEWKNNVDGFDYVRNVTHFNPVRRDIAMMVGFEDLRFGEDQIYSNAVTALCKTEVFLTSPILQYRYSTEIPHEKKYGITR